MRQALASRSVMRYGARAASRVSLAPGRSLTGRVSSGSSSHPLASGGWVPSHSATVATTRAPAGSVSSAPPAVATACSAAKADPMGVLPAPRCRCAGRETGQQAGAFARLALGCPRSARARASPAMRRAIPNSRSFAGRKLSVSSADTMRSMKGPAGAVPTNCAASSVGTAAPTGGLRLDCRQRWPRQRARYAPGRQAARRAGLRRRAGAHQPRGSDHDGVGVDAERAPIGQGHPFGGRSGCPARPSPPPPPDTEGP